MYLLCSSSVTSFSKIWHLFVFCYLEYSRFGRTVECVLYIVNVHFMDNNLITAFFAGHLGPIQLVSGDGSAASQQNPAVVCPVFTTRRSYASAVLGVVILSVRPSVTRVLCD